MPRKGYVPTPEHRAKIGAKNAAVWSDPNHRARVSEKHKERWRSKEGYRAEMSEMHRHNWKDPKWRAKMLAAQRNGKASRKGTCDICGRANPPNRSLARDHDHATGKRRGDLCGRCNIGLGLFSDSAEVLQKAADYLRRAW